MFQSTLLRTCTSDGSVIASKSIDESLSEDSRTRLLAWSSCSGYVIVVNKSCSIYLFDRYCQEVLHVHSSDWVPNDILSCCIQIFSLQPSVKADQNTLKLSFHAVFKSVDVVTFVIEAVKSLVKGMSRASASVLYSDQRVTVSHVERAPDVLSKCFALYPTMSIGSKDVWELDNAFWLQQTGVMILIGHKRKDAITGRLNLWRNKPPKTTDIGSLSVFVIKNDELARDKKRFNLSAQFWSALLMEPSCMDCLPVFRRETRQTDDSREGRPSSGWSLWPWGTSGTAKEQICNVLKVISDPNEK